MDYDTGANNTNTGMAWRDFNELLGRTFMYWSLDKTSKKAYEISVNYKIVTQEEVRDEIDNDIIKQQEKNKTGNIKFYKVEWGKYNAEGVFIPSSYYYTRNMLATKDISNYGLHQLFEDTTSTKYIDFSKISFNTSKTWNKKGIEIINGAGQRVVIDVTITLKQELKGEKNGTAKDYSENVVTPIKNITTAISDLFGPTTKSMLNNKYKTQKLTKEVTATQLAEVLAQDDLKEIINNVRINASNVFKNVVGLESLHTYMAANVDKSVAAYYNSETGTVESNILNPNAIIQTNTNSYKLLSDIMNAYRPYTGYIKDTSTNIQGVLIQALGDDYTSIYNKIYIDDVLIYAIDNNRKDLYDGLEALCKTLGVNDNKYIKGLLLELSNGVQDVTTRNANYQDIVSANSLDLDDATIKTKVEHLMLQDPTNVLANFDLHFDAYDNGFQYWLGQPASAKYRKETSLYRVTYRLTVIANAYTGGNITSESVTKDQHLYSIGYKTTFDMFTTNYNSVKDSNKTDITNYIRDNGVVIKQDIANGERQLAATATYVVKTAAGSNTKFYDNVFDQSGRSEKDKVLNYYVDTAQQETVKYGTSLNTEDNTSTIPINVYTPVHVDTTVETKTVDGFTDTSIFTVKFNNQTVLDGTTQSTIWNKSENVERTRTNKKYYSFATERSTKNIYYIRFAFDTYNVSYINSAGNVVYLAGIQKAGTWIGPLANNVKASVTATEGIDPTYYVMAMQKNAGDSLTDVILKIKNIENAANNIGLTEGEKDVIDELRNVCNDNGNGIHDDGFFNIGTYYIYKRAMQFSMQLFDFKVTDVNDPSWKATFREDDGYTHKGMAYYSGFKKWNYANLLEESKDIFINRGHSELGDFSTNILPIGPHKNANLTYTYAPKLGYTISFDVKVAGVYFNTNVVTIKPEFYYLSKDGNTIKSDIKLFYKNARGKYIEVGTQTDMDYFKLSFVPNDAYRLKETYVKSYLSSNSELLGSLTELKLKASTMATVNNVINQRYSGVITTYYGEYKLPNTTIAVANDGNGNYPINNPLTDGYLGVRFNISASHSIYEATPSSVYKSDAGNIWAHESYSGYEKQDNGSIKYGKIRLEKGVLQINAANQDIIHGTVVLYDLDAKASDDYN